MTLRPFTPDDQSAVRVLILTGLERRFGTINKRLNPDLDDIQAHYVDQGAAVLVLEHNSMIIGCGILIKEHGSDQVARIVRVSVHEDYQRQGHGRTISQRLITIARERGFKRVLVETNNDWTSALRLYQSLGFAEYKRCHVPEHGYTEVHMALQA